MVPQLKTPRQAWTNVQLQFFAVCALLSMAASLAVGCSSGKTGSTPGGVAEPPGQQPSGAGNTAAQAPKSGSAGTTPGQQSSAPASSQGSAGTTGAPTSSQGSAGAMAGKAGGPANAGTQGGQAGMTSMAGASGAGTMTAPHDCTKVAWDNPGKVADPTFVAVAADAGTTGKPFEQGAGMEEYGYVMEEFLFTGTSPAYTTRMMVRRPRDPAKFSGTVFVEWYNVSGGIDFAVLWGNSREYFMREGHVFVGVSAQAVGANALKDYDAKRYAAINHPGDTAADAIFSQAGVALRTQTEKLLGPCMPVHATIALGQSQSGGRLTSYVNNTQNTAKVYDGIMIHSGGEPTNTDPTVPVFVINTMSEGNGSRSDSAHLVKWVIAGATHNDARVTSRGMDLPTASVATEIKCANPLNQYPSYRAYNAALNWLHRWVRKAEKPPAGMLFEMQGGNLKLDDNKNVLGGVRTPHIQVAIATYGFDNAPANSTDFVALLACGLGGNTVPFTESKLTQLYPTHDDYVKKYTAAADEAVAKGYLLQADYDEVVKEAKAAPIPK
jgi:hypothetical protein